MKEVCSTFTVQRRSMMTFFVILVIMSCFKMLTLYFDQSATAARKIYIDFGANDGTSVNYFLSGNQSDANINIDGSKNNKGLLRHSTGDRDPIFNNQKWDVIVFEANPRYNKILSYQQKDFLQRKMAKSYTLYNGTAISTRNGAVSLILDAVRDGDAGTTLMSESHSAVGRTVKIRAIDVCALFKAHNLAERDYIVVKVDVEGAEYALLRRMMHCGLIELVDNMAIEWHHDNPNVFGVGRGVDNSSSPEVYQQQLATQQKYLRQYESLQWLLQDSGFEHKMSTWGRRRRK